MPHKRGHAKAGRGAHGNRTLPPTAQTFRGPVVGRNANQSSAPVELVISQGFQLAAANSGAWYFLFASPASLTDVYSCISTTQFQQLATVYDEFRVLGLQCVFPPLESRYTAQLEGGTSFLTSSFPAYTWAKREPTDEPAMTIGFPAAAASDGFKFCSTTHQTKMTVKMSGTPESNWMSTDVSTYPPTDNTGIGFGVDSHFTEASQTIWVAATWRVQFRSAKYYNVVLRQPAPPVSQKTALCTSEVASQAGNAEDTVAAKVMAALKSAGVG